jgi:hypothetical protein
VKLVSVQDAANHLRCDTDDPMVAFYVDAASALVLNYLKAGADIFLDTTGQVPLDTNGDPLDVPYEVRAATLLQVGYLYKQRDSSDDYQMGYLPPAVTALLYPLRDPALR